MNKYVYFVQRSIDGLIKIGFSGDVTERLKTLRYKNGHMILLGLIPGDMTEEKRIHKIFSFCHHHLEWFIPSQELLDYIDQKAQFRK